MTKAAFPGEEDDEERRPELGMAGRVAWREGTAQQLVRYEALFALLDDIQGIEDIGEISSRLARRWKYFANVAAWRLVVNDEEDFYVIDGHRGHAEALFTDMKGLSEWDVLCRNESRPLFFSPPEACEGIRPPEHLTGKNIGAIQVLPVFHGERCVAVLTAASRKEPFSDLDNRFIRLVADYFADRILSLMLQQRALRLLHTRATRDSLTGILNRGAVMEQLETMLALDMRSFHPLSVIIADIDFFKGINDTYGHQAGDRIIREVARRIQYAARESDCVGRYGGEEFIIVLNNCGASQVVPVAERFRRAVSEQPFETGVLSAEGINITMSCGVSCTDGPAGYYSHELIKEADEALYFSKNNGRNRITIADT